MKSKGKTVGDVMGRQEPEMVWSPKVESFISWRKFLRVTPAELSRRSGISNAFISNVEKGKKPFSEPARTKLWKALHEINKEQQKRLNETPIKEQTPEQKEASEFFSNYMHMAQSMFANPQERMQSLAESQKELIAGQDAQLKLQEAEIARLNTVLELVTKQIDWPATIKRLEAVEAECADLRRLNGLRAEAIGTTAKADELQEQIEQRAKKEKA
jgi:transcriptional regulator with XRE-family HTH domain